MAGSRSPSLQIPFVQREIPKGTIFLWHGTEDDIPIMFNLCNGKRNTPDLRNLFVRGAGGPVAPNTQGGALTHVHTFTTDGISHAFVGPTGLDGAAQFSFITPADTDSGTTDLESLLPPYGGLYYIMYLGCRR